MEKELIEHVAKVAFRAGADLTDLIPLIKEHCDDDEFSAYAKALGAAAAEVHSKVLKLVFSKHPDIEVDFSRKITKYRRVI